MRTNTSGNARGALERFGQLLGLEQLGRPTRLGVGLSLALVAAPLGSGAGCTAETTAQGPSECLPGTTTTSPEGSGSLLFDRPDPWDLGEVAVQVDGFETEAVQIRNAGSAPLAIARLDLRGDDAFTLESVVGPVGDSLAAPYAQVLSPGQWLEVHVRFAPDRPGAHDAVMAIEHDDPGRPSPLERSVVGEGIEPTVLVDASRVISASGSDRATAYDMSCKIISDSNHRIMAWLDSGAQVRVRDYDVATEAWGSTVALGTGTDNHGGPAITMDGEGFVHAVFGPHHGPFQYRRTTAAHDVSSWTQATTFGDRATYPSLVAAPDDTLHVTYRGGAGPNGIMYQRRPTEGSWSEPVRLFHVPVPSSAYTQFGNSLAVDATGSLHLAFHVYDDVQSAGWAIGYLRSADGGESWQASDGTALSLPAGPDGASIIETGPELDARVGSVALDPSGAPWFSAALLGPSPTVRLYHLDAGGWAFVDLAEPLAERYPDRRLVSATITFDEAGTLYVAAATVTAGFSTTFGDDSHEVVLLVSFDRGESFHVVPVSTITLHVGSWLASIERPFGASPIGAPSLIYTRGTAEPTEVVFASLAKRP